MQRLWQAHVPWDEPLPTDIEAEWCRFYESSSYLPYIRIPRHVGSSANCRFHICGFCDTSDKGYAAVIYLLVTGSLGVVTVSLLGAKTKLAPMKGTSTPWLELRGAVLLAVWMSRIKRILKTHLVIGGMFSWSDSTLVLSWLLHLHTSFKTFVSNQIHKVPSLLTDCHWAHVKSESNPADYASCGLKPVELFKHELYWSGPAFLREPVSSWKSKLVTTPIEQLPEVKLVSLVANSSNSSDEFYDRFSSYDQMLHVVAHMRKFIVKCRHADMK